MSRPHRVYVVQGLALDEDRIVACWPVAWFHDGEGARADALAGALYLELEVWDEGGREHPISGTDRVLADLAEMVERGDVKAIAYIVSPVTDDPTARCRCQVATVAVADDCPIHGDDPRAPARVARNAALRKAAVWGRER